MYVDSMPKWWYMTNVTEQIENRDPQLKRETFNVWTMYKFEFSSNAKQQKLFKFSIFSSFVSPWMAKPRMARSILIWNHDVKSSCRKLFSQILCCCHRTQSVAGIDLRSQILSGVSKYHMDFFTSVVAHIMWCKIQLIETIRDNLRWNELSTWK